MEKELEIIRNENKSIIQRLKDARDTFHTIETKLDTVEKDLSVYSKNFSFLLGQFGESI